MRACHTNNCPVGIATQNPLLRARLNIERSSKLLHNYLEVSVAFMQVLARACGHDRLSEFSIGDLATWNRTIADLTGVAYAGDSPSV